MIDGGGGSIINVSSVEGLRGSPWAHGYVASKGVCAVWPNRPPSNWHRTMRVNSIHPA